MESEKRRTRPLGFFPSVAAAPVLASSPRMLNNARVILFGRARPPATWCFTFHAPGKKRLPHLHLSLAAPHHFWLPPPRHHQIHLGQMCPEGRQTDTFCTPASGWVAWEHVAKKKRPFHRARDGFNQQIKIYCYFAQMPFQELVMPWFSSTLCIIL